MGDIICYLPLSTTYFLGNLRKQLPLSWFFLYDPKPQAKATYCWIPVLTPGVSVVLPQAIWACAWFISLPCQNPLKCFFFLENEWKFRGRSLWDRPKKWWKKALFKFPERFSTWNDGWMELEIGGLKPETIFFPKLCRESVKKRQNLGNVFL